MAATSTSFFGISSSSSFNLRRTQFLHPPNYLHSNIKKGVSGQRHVLFQVNCVSEHDKQTVEPESETTSSPSSSEFPSSSAIVAGEESGISAYRWCAALGGIGFLETAYLTYIKLTNSNAFCPTGGASCTNILTSDYSFVFGVPLPLFGMLAYGLVATIGLQLGAKEKTIDSGKSDGDVILIGITTSMAVASAYFLYILNTEFAGEFCLYCLTSATLSFSLFFIALKRFGLDELQKTLGLQLSIAGLVVIALTASYNNAQSMPSSIMDTEIPYFETEIARESSPFAIALAKHLQSIGAKLYGAFWCSHCLEQKEIFGAEATRMLDYVECFPDGVSKGTKMAQACLDVKLEGFPTWIINGQVLEGEKQLSELATISGFRSENIEALASEELELDRYTDSKEGFTLLVPSSWIKVDKAGATVLFEDSSKKANSIGVVVNPTRISSLSEFGTPQFVADKLIQAERRKESTKEADVISVSERSGHDGLQVYEFEYKVDSTRGGLKRVFSAAFVTSKRLYILNITHSDGLENPLGMERRMILEKVLHSFDAISST